MAWSTLDNVTWSEHWQKFHLVSLGARVSGSRKVQVYDVIDEMFASWILLWHAAAAAQMAACICTTQFGMYTDALIVVLTFCSRSSRSHESSTFHQA